MDQHSVSVDIEFDFSLVFEFEEVNNEPTVVFQKKNPYCYCYC
jgi:hypothetical protein